MAPKQMAIPQPFTWLLPGQGLVAGVAIYSTIYVFGVGKIPFILAVIAAGLHFLLGIYFCFTKNRLRAHDLFLVPLVLVAGAGVWGGSLYYFAKILDVIIRLGRFTIGTTNQPEIGTWTKVGTSMTGLNAFIDIVLVIIFIVAALKKTSPYPQQEPIYIPPSAPTPAPTFPVAPVTVQYQQPLQQHYQQQQQQPQQQYYQVTAVSPIQQQPQTHQQQEQQQQPQSPQRVISSSTISDFKTPITSSISPATSPSPSQQYQQYQGPLQQHPPYQQQPQPQPQTMQYEHQRQPSFPFQQHQQQQQQQQQQAPYSPPQQPQSFSPSPPPPPTPPQLFQPQARPPQRAQSYDTHNRIEILRRLSTLQHPLGNWIYTPELSSILQLWGGYSGGSITTNTPAYDVTVMTHALMVGLRDYIWTAQREGREHSALSAGELSSLRSVNWDLAWVGMGIDRAGAWLAQGQAQTQGLGGGYR